MEVAASVLGTVSSARALALGIYEQCNQATTNKKLCGDLKNRIQLLMRVWEELEKQPEKVELLVEALKDFRCNLENAGVWVGTYSDQRWWKKFLLASGMYRKFLHINDQLSATAQAVQILLLEESREKFLKMYRSNCWKSLEKDVNNLIRISESEMKTVNAKVDSVMKEVQDIKQLLMPESLKPWDIKEIPAKVLIRRKLLVEDDHHRLYIGEYHFNAVLIKDLKGQLSLDNGTIRKTFESECRIMRKYESPNILKLFGICIDQSDTGPRYSLVTEYCEKGTLRDLLRTEPDLEWDQRLIMALDAARAVYWIHHTENKAILHGNLNSKKFLVTASYCLKLSGFEFSKTETSMRRNASERSERKLEWACIAPETLQNINDYDMRSEIYSLGIVIYEITTGSLPLQGKGPSDGNLDHKLIYDMVSAEVSAGLPDKCPSILRNIIQKCLQRDPWDRPTAGGISNWLVAYDRELQATSMDTA